MRHYRGDSNDTPDKSTVEHSWLLLLFGGRRGPGNGSKSAVNAAGSGERPGSGT